MKGPRLERTASLITFFCKERAPVPPVYLHLCSKMVYIGSVRILITDVSITNA